MSKALVLTAIATLVVAQASSSPLRSTLIFTSPGRVTEATTADGRRFYYVRDITQLRFYDRQTKRDTLLLTGLGNRSDLAVSRAGDRLAFVKADEGGTSLFVWTLPLNPGTGLASGPARRVGLTNATDPSFSPDGRSIAFHAPQPARAGNLVVVPTAGGPERVVARTRGWVWPSQWTPDGKTIYFGLNIDDPAHTRESGIYRVPAAGGTPERVAATPAWSTSAGLSLDGRLLFHYSESGDSIVARIVDGPRLAVYRPALNEHEPGRWYSSTKTLGVGGRQPAIVTVRDLVTGTSRTIADSAEYSLFAWSPDGRHVAIRALNRSEIIIVSADGAVRRTLKTRHVASYESPFFWSPTGATIGYGHRPDGKELSVIDVASGAERNLGTFTGIVAPRWRSDGRAILVATTDSQRAPDSTSLVTIHELMSDGTRRAAGTARVFCPQVWVCNAKFANDSQLVSWSNGGAVYRVFSFRRSDAGRFLFRREQPGMTPIPVLSANGQWLAIRERDASGENRRLHIMRLDGSVSKTITVPFNVTQGGSNPHVSDDGRELIVAAAQLRQLDSVRVHRVNVETGQPTSLFTAARQQLAFSPDGRLVAYSNFLPQFTEFWEVDVSNLVRPSPRAR